MIRLVVFLVALLFATPAQAIPCWKVRAYVKLYGEAAVEQYARSQGATDKQIAEHKRCLR